MNLERYTQKSQEALARLSTPGTGIQPPEHRTAAPAAGAAAPIRGRGPGGRHPGSRQRPGADR
jgi:hypothetical protein